MRRIVVLPLSRKAGVANQEKQRIERSEAIQWGEVLAGGWLEARNRPNKSAERLNEPVAAATHPTAARAIRA